MTFLCPQGRGECRVPPFMSQHPPQGEPALTCSHHLRREASGDIWGSLSPLYNLSGHPSKGWEQPFQSSPKASLGLVLVPKEFSMCSCPSWQCSCCALTTHDFHFSYLCTRFSTFIGPSLFSPPGLRNLGMPVSSFSIVLIGQTVLEDTPSFSPLFPPSHPSLGMFCCFLHGQKPCCSLLSPDPPALLPPLS